MFATKLCPQSLLSLLEKMQRLVRRLQANTGILVAMPLEGEDVPFSEPSPITSLNQADLELGPSQAESFCATSSSVSASAGSVGATGSVAAPRKSEAPAVALTTSSADGVRSSGAWQVQDRVRLLLHALDSALGTKKQYVRLL